jgi:hypothetical protein
MSACKKALVSSRTATKNYIYNLVSAAESLIIQKQKDALLVLLGK